MQMMIGSPLSGMSFPLAGGEKGAAVVAFLLLISIVVDKKERIDRDKILGHYSPSVT